jgi:hypothetical protein
VGLTLLVALAVRQISGQVARVVPAVSVVQRTLVRGRVALIRVILPIRRHPITTRPWRVVLHRVRQASRARVQELLIRRLDLHRSLAH